MNNLTVIENKQPAIYEMEQSQAIAVLQESLYPGAKPQSIALVMDYCRAANLDPMQKPVHIVPMWDKASNGMRDVIMPGVNSYRVNAMRSGDYVGISEPEFGPMVDGACVGMANFQFPEWCRVTVKRILRGQVAEFVAVEYWQENYATTSKKEITPNAMWKKRPRGQIAKCAEAQALRKAFPEIASAPTYEEMEGKFDAQKPEPEKTVKHMGNAEVVEPAFTQEEIEALGARMIEAAPGGSAGLGAFWKSLSIKERNALRGTDFYAQADAIATEADEAKKPLAQRLSEAKDLDTLYLLGNSVEDLSAEETAALEKRQAELKG